MGATAPAPALQMRIASLLKQRLSVNTLVRVGLGIALVLLFILHEGDVLPLRALQFLEQQAYDVRLRFFMPRTVDPRIVILDIDEKSLIAEGRWPWGRDKLALMVRQLFDRYHASVMGFDIAFPEPDRSSGIDTLDRLATGDLKDDAEFKSFLQRSRETLDYDKVFADEIGRHPVVLGFFMGPRQERSGVLPPPLLLEKDLGAARFRTTEAMGYSGNRAELQKQAAGAGHLSPGLDFDGVTRRVPMLLKYGDGYYEAMSLALAQVYLGNVPVRVITETVGHGANAIGVISALALADKTIPLDDSMSALVPYRGGRGSFRYVSATDVIRGNLDPGDLKDKIVIVGTSAQGLLDIRQTPVGEDYPGVEVHANMVSGILDQTIKHRPAEGRAISVLLLLVTGLPLAILLPRTGALASSAMAAGLLALVVGVNIYAWTSQNYVLDIAANVVLVLVLYLFNMVYGFFMEARSRRLITGLFGTYVPKELVDEMSRNPEEYSMRGESRQMTVLFSDVRDFTSISEGLPAEGLKDLMNLYLSEMTEVIQEKRGTIDKYIGDAIMAFWGAPLADPGHAAHGLEAALGMQKRIRGLDAEFVKRGWPMLHIGVGVNCGEMNVGDMGSKFRRAYTVMGDSVNLASRLEGLTKEYGVGILVSENIVASAQGFVYREIDRVVVKGRTEGVAIFEPLGRAGEVPEPEMQEADRFHKALELYRKRRWVEALRILEELAARSPETKLYKVYVARATHFAETAPEPAWNGTWVFTTK
ncbi:MAG TPA: adenylate/guanylate cyclase domain-containing protein [Usitatibacter sp.]|nr:adenylate/guanylate cyclase domain-containing protein [Usitatibacter sp.]